MFLQSGAEITKAKKLAESSFKNTASKFSIQKTKQNKMKSNKSSESEWPSELEDKRTTSSKAPRKLFLNYNSIPNIISQV